MIYGLSIFVVSFTPSIFPFFMIVLKALGDKKVIVLKEMQMNFLDAETFTMFVLHSAAADINQLYL